MRRPTTEEEQAMRAKLAAAEARALQAEADLAKESATCLSLVWQLALEKTTPW